MPALKINAKHKNRSPFPVSGSGILQRKQETLYPASRILYPACCGRKVGMKAWIWRWGPAILMMVVIFIASATPGSDLPEFGGWDFFAKKGGHMLGYAILAASFFHALNHHRNSRQSQFWKAVCLAIIYAASDEWHQKFTPGRTASVRDVMIDGVGACLGLALWCWIKTHIPGRKAKTRQIAEI